MMILFSFFQIFGAGDISKNVSRLKKIDEEIKSFEHRIIENSRIIDQLENQLCRIESKILHLKSSSEIRELEAQKSRLQSDFENKIKTIETTKYQAINDISMKINHKKLEIFTQEEHQRKVTNLLLRHENINEMHRRRITILRLEKNKL
ncbi:hypothetical protein EDEG_02942 [Edhazardia aedis USNM 41457]|uniref:Uncharacterized protein n=1 Tax=Edhazardia aedis (strain USNM 41457) TaxID=1003232 RepID=J9D555_EDHAE|nr:hypothetical protein EDEG_02942 [Edhazardia aedis USNM 41457]|eukprot:EJW02659.1 hypothetical protein EDEG_02942 [Edhazardia aedis USNM 41457]